MNRAPKRLRDADIEAYVRAHPDAQYFDVLRGLHAAGYRVNRHGSGELLGRYEDARKKVLGDRVAESRTSRAPRFAR